MAIQSNGPEMNSGVAGRTMRNSDGGVSPSKRALLKAGWAVPVILAISLPQSSYASNVSGGKVCRPDKGPHFGSKPGKPREDC
jgi:hypothetical protein